MGVGELRRETGSFLESSHPGHLDYQAQAHTQVIVNQELISQLNPRVISQSNLKIISQLNLLQPDKNKNL